MYNKCKVYVEDNAADYERMFIGAGFKVVDNAYKADLICFIGGADVNPALYDHQVHPTTGYNIPTDDWSMGLYKIATETGVPMVGICRGAQFLNVMNGGTMYQDVNGHAIGRTHEMELLSDGSKWQVSSTHHQMMNPGLGGRVLGVAHISSYRVLWSTTSNRWVDPRDFNVNDFPDVEIVYYEDTNSLCFQPHPEFFGSEHPCQQLFMKLVEEKLL